MASDVKVAVYLAPLSQWLAMQAIVVPVNNWLEPNVGDGKQEVCQASSALSEPFTCPALLRLPLTQGMLCTWCLVQRMFGEMHTY